MVDNAEKPSLLKKIYVLDTNVLLHDPNALFSFEGIPIGIPSVVLEEIDNFKKEGTDRGRNSRETIRILDSLRSRGSLKDGVLLDNGSTVKVLFLENVIPSLPFQLSIKDNEILLHALVLKNNGYDVKFISKDLNARVKADALGLETEDYLKEYVTQEDFYQGWVRVQVPMVQLKGEFPPVLHDLLEEKALALNQFVLVENQHNPHNYKVFRYIGGKNFKPVYEPQIKWPLRARNPQQIMALDLLFDEDIQFVTLMGPAGTGKTFLALLAGLYKVLIKNKYQKILVSRPVIPLGKDVGFLPGELKEKLHNWMLPIYDNMEFIVHSIKMNRHEHGTDAGHEPYNASKPKGKYKDHHKEHGGQEHKGNGLMSLDELIYRGKISLEAITYMRGRSIPYQFILIDEAQNLTPHEVKALVTRVGAGSKIVLTGDPYQIDSPYLDFSSNGLITTSEKFKGQGLFGSVYLPISERGELSKIAGELL
ncbi:MAG: PhoH family protein [Candidatus Dependentiae bacterium]|nr:PhoH family protein [Candidatus Dependentiae bacterium]